MDFDAEKTEQDSVKSYGRRGSITTKTLRYSQAWADDLLNTTDCTHHEHVVDEEIICPVSRTIKLLKQLFLDDFCSVDLMHARHSKHTYLFKATDKLGYAGVIKALALPYGMHISEIRNHKLRFNAEADLTYGLNMILGGCGIAKVKKCGTKYPIRYPELHKSLLNRQIPFSIPYFVMDYYHEGDLDLLARNNAPLSSDKLVDIFHKVSGTVSFVHDNYSIVHRDIKPANIFLGQGLQPFLGDFGAAEVMGNIERTDEIGTIPYFSPNQAKSIIALNNRQPIPAHDYRTDLYTLSLVLADLLFLDNPDNPVQLMGNMFNQEYDYYAYVASDPDIVFPGTGISELDDIIHRGVSNDKKSRFKSMKEFSDALGCIKKKL